MLKTQAEPLLICGGEGNSVTLQTMFGKFCLMNKNL